MGQFYASLESGHAMASTALKRRVGYRGINSIEPAEIWGECLRVMHIVSAAIAVGLLTRLAIET